MYWVHFLNFFILDGPGAIQPKIQMDPKESSMVELFYLKFDWFDDALGEYMERFLHPAASLIG